MSHLFNFCAFWLCGRRGSADGLALKTSAEAEWNGPTMAEKFERSPPPFRPSFASCPEPRRPGGRCEKRRPRPVELLSRVWIYTYVELVGMRLQRLHMTQSQTPPQLPAATFKTQQPTFLQKSALGEPHPLCGSQLWMDPY